VQDTRNTLAAVQSNQGVATGVGGAGVAVGSGGIPSVPSIPGVNTIGISGVPSTGLPAGVQSALQTAQNVQSFQFTLDQIKSEQERVRKEQERIRQERERLERQTAATPVGAQ
jgi:hypothetical protein